MLQLSKHKNNESDNSLVDSLMNLIRTHQGMNFPSDNSKTDTFIVAQDKCGSICGGAFLQTRKIEHLQSKIGKVLSFSTPDEKEIWTCVVCFAPEEIKTLNETEHVKMGNSFYRQLFTLLLKFGEEHNIRLLCLIMEEKQYLRTIRTGLWPYIAVLKPDDSSDGFFHGILPLYGSKVEIYKETLSALDRLSYGPTITLEEFEKLEKGEVRLTRDIYIGP